jgi:hypothetical protein
MVIQLFLYIYIYIYRAIYNSNGGGYHTRVCRQYFLYSISYIVHSIICPLKLRVEDQPET